MFQKCKVYIEFLSANCVQLVTLYRSKQYTFDPSKDDGTVLDLITLERYKSRPKYEERNFWCRVECEDVDDPKSSWFVTPYVRKGDDEDDFRELEVVSLDENNKAVYNVTFKVDK